MNAILNGWLNARFLKYIYDIRSSYWFIPTLMALGALVLSFVTTGIDANLDVDWAEKVVGVYSNRPAGARAVLSTVAGSMITVAGVTFSLTILAVSHATSQFGPRVLTNFMRDRGNQITLGTFIATFLYCIMVLRTVRTAEEAREGMEVGDLGQAFVPQISLLVSILMALASVGVLIYFFHHIPESISLSNVVAAVSREMLATTDELFPEDTGHGEHEVDEAGGPGDKPEDFYENGKVVTLASQGYVEAINAELLLKIASENDLIVEFHQHPGSFISYGSKVFTAWPAERVPDDVESNLRSTLATGTERTPTQNLLFTVDQLAELAARALSPGVNDPGTAMICLDWLGNMLHAILKRNDPSPYRYDDDHKLRVIAEPTRFRDVVDAVFGQLRNYFATDRNAALHMMRLLVKLELAADRPERARMLRMQRSQLVLAAEHAGLAEMDLAELRDISQQADRDKCEE